MITPDLGRASWRTSSYSTNQANCVEVAVTAPAVAVRDSKHPSGGVLAFPGPSWSTFVRGITAGR
ncbi:MAG: DUF397 domain-containing protein [Sciscionella sp.]